MSIVNALNAARMKFDPAALRPRPLGQPAALAPRVLQSQRTPAQLSFNFKRS